jgi:FdhE protein
MQRTIPGLRPDSAARLDDLRRQRPEWQIWLGLLAEIQRELDTASQPMSLDQASADLPLLHGRTLKVDGARTERLVRRLASKSRIRVGAGAAVPLLEAAIRRDRDEIGVLARADNIDPGALTSVAELAALPLLRSCARALGDRVPRFWPHGYCPICASWPILAERRGLDRSRRLRCGRCASEWEIQWLCCVYCGNREHERLGSMILEEGGETLKVETCMACRGYLKSVATLQAIPHFELLLQDLETIELDLVALDRGYQRPPGLGFALEVHVVDHATG